MAELIMLGHTKHQRVSHKLSMTTHDDFQAGKEMASAITAVLVWNAKH